MGGPKPETSTLVAAGAVVTAYHAADTVSGGLLDEMKGGVPTSLLHDPSNPGLCGSKWAGRVAGTAAELASGAGAGKGALKGIQVGGGRFAGQAPRGIPPTPPVVRQGTDGIRSAEGNFNY